MQRNKFVTKEDPRERSSKCWCGVETHLPGQYYHIQPLKDDPGSFRADVYFEKPPKFVKIDFSIKTEV